MYEEKKMNDKIKVSEVTAILQEQLEGIASEAQVEEIGTVLQVSDGVVRIFGLSNAEASELLQFDNGLEAIVMNLEEDNVGAVLLGPTDMVEEGDTVRRTGRKASKVDDIHNGTDLETPFTGKGVIVGVIDQGFQFKHRAFLNEDGESRALAIWKHKISYTKPTTVIPDTGDEITMRLKNVRMASDQSVVYGTDGTVEVKYVCGNKPVALTGTTNLLWPSSFKSYYMSNYPVFLLVSFTSFK